MSIPIESAVPLLAVFDVPRSIAFYRDALGFEGGQHLETFHRCPG